MLFDHTVPKPLSVGVYASHQLVEGLTDGSRPLFVDNGDHLIIRSNDPDLTQSSQPVRDVVIGDIIGFELRASCGVKVKGQHRYFSLNDWRSRHAWLGRRATGFEVLTVNVTARRVPIEKGGRTIHIDRSDFTGIMKVTDVAAFQLVLAKGISGPGRAFGHGMLVV